MNDVKHNVSHALSGAFYFGGMFALTATALKNTKMCSPKAALALGALAGAIYNVAALQIEKGLVHFGLEKEKDHTYETGNYSKLLSGTLALICSTFVLRSYGFKTSGYNAAALGLIGAGVQVLQTKLLRTD